MFEYHMINSVTLDLPHTDLADFAEHFERLMERRPRVIIYDLPALNMGQFEDVAFDDLPPDTQRLLQVKGMTIVHIKRSVYGATGRGYSISASQTELFRLAVERYRRDRLRLGYSEAIGPLRYARPFIEWLLPRWGQPIYHLNLDLNLRL